jgi:hypothetical protein
MKTFCPDERMFNEALTTAKESIRKARQRYHDAKDEARKAEAAKNNQASTNRSLFFLNCDILTR